MASGTPRKAPGDILRDLTAGGAYKTITKIKPSGSLQARRQSDGAVAFAWRFSFTGADGVEREHRESIGFYDGRLPPKSLMPKGANYSVEAAVRAAEALAQRHHEHRPQGGLPALKAAAQAAQRRSQQSQEEAARHSLQRLLEDYSDHLEALGREAHRDVRSIVKHHVLEPFAELAAKPAADIQPEDVADMMRRANAAGKLRTANKLRSYLRAAFEVAKGARTDASVPEHFKGYGVRVNPASETRVVKSGKRPVIRPLSHDQLRTYWRIIKSLPGLRGAALRLHLLTGGQRLDQLVRLTSGDIGEGVITLHDGKGRPGEAARPHLIPLIPQAAQALSECASREGEWALTTDGGRTHIAGETLSGWAIEAVESEIADFQPKRIRSGIETLLAANGVDKETRGRLQSHGIRGVQDRHYNAHEYLAEKRKALTKLLRLLEPPRASRSGKPRA